MKIEKLEYYSSSRDGYTFESRPNRNDIVDKINEIIDKLNEMDDDEPIKHGKWIYTECKTLKSEGFGYFKCSECGHPVWYKEIPYCSNCGAKMDLIEEKQE
jgi:DNA-directed RNA polymerase subunit RPC12/RpoP